MGSAYHAADVGEPVDARGGQGEQPAAKDVEQDLDDVEQVHHDRAFRSRPRPSAGPSAGSSPERVPLLHSAKSTTGVSGLRNPMAYRLERVLVRGSVSPSLQALAHLMTTFALVHVARAWCWRSGLTPLQRQARP